MYISVHTIICNMGDAICNEEFYKKLDEEMKKYIIDSWKGND